MKAKTSEDEIRVEIFAFKSNERRFPMDEISQILRTVGRIEGRIEGLCNLNERVHRLEQWQLRLKGGWTVLASVCAVLCKAIYGK